jgi:hypothetical protein
MNTSNRALRFVNLLPLTTSARPGRKPVLTPTQSVPSVEAVNSAPSGDDNVMVKRRAEALRAFFPKVFSWFAGRWDLDGMSEVNHYLSQATDAADLERRIHRLERRRHFGS